MTWTIESGLIESRVSRGHNWTTTQIGSIAQDLESCYKEEAWEKPLILPFEK